MSEFVWHHRKFELRKCLVEPWLGADCRPSEFISGETICEKDGDWWLVHKVLYHKEKRPSKEILSKNWPNINMLWASLSPKDTKQQIKFNIFPRSLAVLLRFVARAADSGGERQSEHPLSRIETHRGRRGTSNEYDNILCDAVGKRATCWGHSIITRFRRRALALVQSPWQAWRRGLRHCLHGAA